MGAAKDIWWTEVGKKDSIELVDILGLLNFTPKEELEKAAEDKLERLLNPPKKQAPGNTGDAASGATGGEREKLDAPTWEELVGMDIDGLVRYGVAFGGDETSLSSVGAVNPAALRRSVAKLCGVTPKPVGGGTASKEQTAPAASDENIPF